MSLSSIDQSSGVELVLKFTVATALNYIWLVFQYSASWLGPQTDALSVDVHAGIAFLTILLLGATGAAASGIAIGLQFAQINPVNNWFNFCTLVLLSTVLQYVVVRIYLHLSDVGTTLRRLRLRHLLVLGFIFSADYTIAKALIEIDLQKIGPTFLQNMLNNLLGILVVLFLLRLTAALSKSLVPSHPRI